MEEFAQQQPSDFDQGDHGYYIGDDYDDDDGQAKDCDQDCCHGGICSRQPSGMIMIMHGDDDIDDIDDHDEQYGQNYC